MHLLCNVIKFHNSVWSYWLNYCCGRPEFHSLLISCQLSSVYIKIKAKSKCDPLKFVEFWKLGEVYTNGWAIDKRPQTYKELKQPLCLDVNFI